MVNQVSLGVVKGLAHIEEIAATKPDASHRTRALIGWINHCAKGVIGIEPNVDVIPTQGWKRPSPDKHAVSHSIMAFVGVDAYAAQRQGDNRGNNNYPLVQRLPLVRVREKHLTRFIRDLSAYFHYRPENGGEVHRENDFAKGRVEIQSQN
jgi:hypothetical protein